MFQLIVTPQGIEKVTIQLIDTPTKVYAIGARLFLSKVPLEQAFFNITWEVRRGAILRDIEFFPWVFPLSFEFFGFLLIFS